MSNIVPEKGINFNVYADNGEVLGVAEGTLPNIEFMTTEIKGAGIAGVVESPGIGQASSITVDLTWRNRTKSWFDLLQPGGHNLDMYSAEGDFDAGMGDYVTRSVHVYMKAVTKVGDMGKLAVSEGTETKTTHEIYYLKVDVDNEEQLVIDKYNYKYRVKGIDYMTEIRAALGKQ